MCDEGRFGWKYVHSEKRLTSPELRSNGQVTSRDWSAVLTAVQASLKKAAQAGKGKLAAVLSPWMTVEEAWMLAGYLKSLSETVTLALGPVRVSGEDDHYPKDIRGRSIEPVKFTIRAEKCPNRAGVEAVLKHFAGEITPFEELIRLSSAGQFQAVYLVGGDPEGWISDLQAEAFSKTSTVIVQDYLPSPVLRHATHVLPSGTFPERDGTFVNHKGLGQLIRRSIRTPGDSRPDGRILWDLSGRRGLAHYELLREEVAQAVPALSSLTDSTLSENGAVVGAGAR
jgi:NADH-quinone oxidoreductase subunit G